MSVIDHCPLHKIAENAHNVRRDVGDVTELADSISAHGLLEPLVVAPNPGNDEQPFVLIAGHRRLAAARQAGLTDTTVVVRADLIDVASQLEAMLVENLQRVDITPVEEGQAYKQLLAFADCTPADIAKRTGRAVATVKGRLSLATLSADTQNRVHHGDVTLADAMAIAEWSDDPAAVAELEKALGTYDFQHCLQRLRAAREYAKASAMARARCAADGVPVIDTPASWPWGSTEQPLYRIDLTVEAHKACPGHAALIDRVGAAVYLCTDPDAHHPDGDATNDDEVSLGQHPERQSPQQTWELDRAARELGIRNPSGIYTPEQKQAIAAHLAEKARVEGVLITAEEVRGAHVESLQRSDRKPPKDTVALLIALKVIQIDGIEVCAPLLGTAVPYDLDADTIELNLWFIDQVLTAKADVVARLALEAMRHELEGELSTPWRRTQDWSDNHEYRAWFAYLVRNGYPITPEETAKVTPAPEPEDDDQ
ncbi:MAG: ParB/RepB/Spo0J family partition protein [Actinomycetes bacterium]